MDNVTHPKHIELRPEYFIRIGFKEDALPKPYKAKKEILNERACFFGAVALLSLTPIIIQLKMMGVF